MTEPGRSDSEPGPSSHCWWTISSEALIDMLRRVSEGENPDLVYMEEWANSHSELIEPDDGDEP